MLVSVSGTFRVEGSGNLDTQTDKVMNALLVAESNSNGVLCDSDIQANLAQRSVTVIVAVNADSVDAANEIGTLAITEAITAAGGTLAPRNRHSKFITQSRNAELVCA